MRQLKNTTWAFLAVLLLVMGCKSYKQVSLKSEEFFADEQLAKDIGIGYYNLYMHHGTTSFQVKDPKVANGSLSGKLERVDQSTVKLKPRGRKEADAHKRDIHVWLKQPPVDSTGKATVSSADIKKVAMYGNDDKRGAKILVRGLVALILGALIIVGFVYLLAKGSDNATNGSNSGSGSGGSNSGCYVATMVYGSYEAPEVLVLRRFRDRFLARFSAGRSFITWYYRNSPGFVDRYRHSKTVNSGVRVILNVFIRVLKWAGFNN